MNLEQFFARLRASAASLTTRQIVTLSAAFLAAVALTIGSAYWLNTPTYAVLFSDMDAESAGSVVTKLKNEKVAYVVDDGGRTVRVPSNRVDELRLDFASQGMPASGRIGFEIFDRTAFGVTDFLEHVNYRRALEGELARTISTLGDVGGARVHIAMPQPSLFAGREQPTKASVVLKLRSNRQLAPSTVNAITGLVAASVESLKAESVVIIDNYGRPLSRVGTETEAADGVPLERQQRIERDLSTRVVALLTPIVGDGRVRVNVHAQLKSDTQEETEERWDPTPVVRSRQSVTQTAPGIAAAHGVAGARSNLPPDQSKPAEGATTTTAANAATSAGVVPPTSGAHTAETTNYELSKVTRHSLQPRGEVVRLSVAVVVDDDRPAPAAGQTTREAKPRNAADIQKLHDLVAASVGLDTDRGDQLTVENIAFEEVPVEEVAVPSVWKRYTPLALEVGRIVGIVLIGVFALFGVIRPMMRTSLTGPPAVRGVAAVAGGPPRTVQDLEAEMDAQLQVAEGQNAGSRKLPVLTRRVAALTQREPENAARLLRTWLTEEER